MSFDFTSLEQLASEAPDFIKVVEDGAAVAATFKSGGIVAAVMQAATFEADVLKVVNDLMALGVTKAVAAGTVTAVPAA